MNLTKFLNILGDDEPKKLSHRQKQRASRRTKKKEERKLVKKEKKKGGKKEDNIESKFLSVYFFSSYVLCFNFLHLVIINCNLIKSFYYLQFQIIL